MDSWNCSGRYQVFAKGRGSMLTLVPHPNSRSRLPGVTLTFDFLKGEQPSRDPKHTAAILLYQEMSDNSSISRLG